jgi:SulP family sulfate permease
VGSFAALYLNGHYGVDVTHVKTVGALPAGLPPLSAPDFSFGALHQMLFPSLIITMLALTEAVSISRAIATKSGQHIDGNQEFVGQGLSNLVGSFFSSYPSSGSFNRSGVNYAAGARTPLAAVFASLFLVVILLLVAPLAAYLPNAAMAGILFLVAWGLIDFHHIGLLPKISRQETIVLWVTLLGTLVDLEKGIFFGIALSLVFYLYRTSRPTLEPVLPDAEPESYHYVPLDGRPECPQVKMMRFNGSIFFGAVAYLQQQLQQLEELEPERKHLVVMASGMNFVDLAGAEFLAEAARQRRKAGGALYFYRMKDSLVQTMQRGHFMDDVGMDNLFPAKSRPIETIYSKLDNEICRNCPVRAFAVCQTHLPSGEARTA